MSIFDEQIKKRNQLETELFTESYRKLAEVVTGDQNGLKLDQGMLLNRRVIEDIAEVLNITVPYSLHEDYSVQYYLDKLFRPRGVMWREIRLGERWYTDAMGVMLGSLEDGRRVALIPYGLNGYAYRDPDTGKKIIGFQLPEWPQLIDTAKELARMLPEHPFIGWDFAHTDEGWVLIEGNRKSQFVGPQISEDKGYYDVFNASVRAELLERNLV